MQRVLLFAALSSLTWAYTLSHRPLPDGRIVGGHETIIELFPFMASLHSLGKHICGGSIISSTAVTTAAHCVENTFPFLLKVRVGSTSVSSGGTKHTVYQIKRHPSYDPETLDYDVALVFVFFSFTFSEKVQPIALAPTDYSLIEGTKVNVTGWGVTSEGGSSPTNLHTVELYLVDNLNCSGQYVSEEVTQRMLCAASLGKDSCQGDSGGPLSVDNLLVGTVSWGFGCADPDYPGVYASIPALSDWISSNV